MNKLTQTNTTPAAADPDLDDLTEIDTNRVNDLQSNHRDQPLADNSVQSYRSDIQDLNRWLAENDRTVNGHALRDYFQEREEQLAPATLNRKRYSILQVLKTYGNGYAPMIEAIEREIKENTSTYETKSAVDGDAIPTRREVQTLMEAGRSLGRDRLSLVIEFLWKTAVRVSEMIEVRTARDIEENGRIKIRIRGKGQKERTVKIEPEFYERIRETFDHPEADHLFHTSTGNPYNRSNLYRQLKRLARMVDLENVTTPHAFRHARATWMLENGFSLKAVSNYLGHSSTAITADLYIHDSVDYDRLAELDREEG